MTRRRRKPRVKKARRRTGASRATAKDPARDPLYRAKGLGRSKDGRSASDHDEFLYGWRR